MGVLRFAAAGNYSRFWNELKNLSKEIHKPAALLFLDACFSTMVFGSGMQDYLNYRFYRRTLKERAQYVTIGYQANMDRHAASTAYAPFFSVKPNFHRNFSAYTKRDWYSTELGFEKYLMFLERHPVFIYKPRVGLCGENVQKLYTRDISDKRAFFRRLAEENAFIEEMVVQHDSWAKLCPASLNTLRVMTTAVNGKSKIIFAAARIGNGRSVTDNFSGGGMAVLVDRETGRLRGNALNKKLESFSRHPVTDLQLDGYPVPYWREIQQMCKKAALVNEGVNLMGWDVGITNDGPLLIEGNRGPGWDLVQVLLGKGCKYLIRPMIMEMKISGLWNSKHSSPTLQHTKNNAQAEASRSTDRSSLSAWKLYDKSTQSMRNNGNGFIKDKIQ